MRTAPTKVYRIVRRPLGRDDVDWTPYTTYTSRTFRPYTNIGTARSIVGSVKNTTFGRQYEWAVQVSELNWEMV